MFTFILQNLQFSNILVSAKNAFWDEKQSESRYTGKRLHTFVTAFDDFYLAYIIPNLVYKMS